MTENVTACPSSEELRNFLAGRLDVAHTDQLALHVESCASCQKQMEEFDDGDGDASVDEMIDRDNALAFTDESQCGRILEQIAGAKGAAAATALATTANLSDDSKRPHSLGDYQLLERLGQGGIGTVYRARHVAMGTIAAVKILQPHRQADQATIDRFQREMVALGRLDHPNIVRALDAGEEKGQHYLVMEFVDGTDLGRLTNSHGPLAVADASEVIRQAALGLSYVHRHGRVHRDVKPSNLMLSKDGTVKLLDLGLARVEEYPMDETVGDADDILGGSTVDLTRTHQVMGTLEYMPPEQASDSHHVDHRADLYSLGCTFYKLLTGHSPFASNKSITALSQLMAHVQTPATPVCQQRAGVPQGLSDLLDRMLSKSPEDRPQSADEIAEALVPFADGANLTAVAKASEDTQTLASATAATVDDASTAPMAQLGNTTDSKQPKQHGGKASWIPVTAVAMLFLGLATAIVAARVFEPTGTVIVQAESAEVAELLASGDARFVANDRSYPLTTGQNDLPEDAYTTTSNDGLPLIFSPSTLDLKRNQRVVVSVSLAPKPTRDIKPPPPPEPIAYEPVELIPLLDPLRDIRGDDWKVVDGSLVSNRDTQSLLIFPYDPPDEYRVELIATRLDGDESLLLGLDAGGTPLIIGIDTYPKRGPRTGIRSINGAEMSRSHNIHHGQLLPMNEAVSIVATVRRTRSRVSVEMSVDGEQVVSWRGEKSHVTHTGAHQLPEPSTLYIANFPCTIRVSDLRVFPLSGEGKTVGFADPSEHPVLAAAQRVLWKGGTIAIVDETAPPTDTPPGAIGGFELMREYEGHTGPIKSVDLSPDGRMAASGSGWPSGDQTVRIWDVESSETLRVIEAGFNVMHVEFAPDGKSVVACGLSTTLKRWDIKTGNLIQKYTPGIYNKFEELAFTSNGDRIVTVSGRRKHLFVIDSASEKVLLSKSLPRTAITFDISPDDRELALGLGSGNVAILEMESGKELRRLARAETGNNNEIFSIQISDDGAKILAGYGSHKVRLWDYPSGRVLQDFLTPASGNEFVEFTPDGKHAVVGARDEGVTSLLDLNSGAVLGTTPLGSDRGWGAAITPDGESVLVANGPRNSSTDDMDCKLRLWKIGQAGMPTDEPQKTPTPTRTVETLADLPEDFQIISIDLQGSDWFRAEDAAFITNIPGLAEIIVDGAERASEFLSGLGPLENLERISAQDLKLDTIPVELNKKFPGLRELDLRNSQIDTEQVEAFKQLENLKTLNLSGTRVDQVEPFLGNSFNSLTRLELLETPLDKPALNRLIEARPDIQVISGHGRLDVLQLVDLKQDAIGLGWAIQGDHLKVVPALRSAVNQHTAVTLPVFLPPEFELECDFTRLSGTHSPLFQLPLPDGTRVMVAFDHGPNDGGFAIIHGVDGAMEKNSPSKTPGVMVPFGAETSTRLRIRVEGTDDNIRVSAFANEQLITFWEGERKRLRPKFYVEAEHPLIPTIVASTQEVSFAISKIELTPLSGETILTRYRQRKPEEGLDRKVADWILQQGGRVRIGPSGDYSSRRTIELIQDLPNEPFRVIGVNTIELGAAITIDGDWLRRFSELEKLQQIALGNGNFENSDLALLLDAPQLRRVYFDRSSLDDRAITILSRLKNLTHIGVSHTNVTNEGLAHLSGNEKLVHLFCGSTKMDGKLMEIAGSLPNLQRLTVYEVGLTGEELKHLTQLNRLTDLGLKNVSQLLAKDMEVIASRSGLTVLALSGGSLGPDAITRLSPLSRLKTLVLTDNQIGDEGMARLLAFRTLSELRVGNNEVTDAGVEAIANLVSIRTLSLAENPGITDTSVDYIGKLRLLGELDVTNTSMTAQGIDRLKTLLPRCSILAADGVAAEGEDQ